MLSPGRVAAVDNMDSKDLVRTLCGLLDHYDILTARLKIYGVLRILKRQKLVHIGFELDICLTTCFHYYQMWFHQMKNGL